MEKVILFLYMMIRNLAIKQLAVEIHIAVERDLSKVLSNEENASKKLKKYLLDRRFDAQSRIHNIENIQKFLSVILQTMKNLKSPVTAFDVYIIGYSGAAKKILNNLHLFDEDVPKKIIIKRIIRKGIKHALIKMFKLLRKFTIDKIKICLIDYDMYLSDVMIFEYFGITQIPMWGNHQQSQLQTIPIQQLNQLQPIQQTQQQTQLEDVNDNDDPLQR